MSAAWLPPEAFSLACAALPLVSVDLCLTRPGPDGTELLLGLRNNRPAQGWWFTPGGRIRKNEPLANASARIVLDELGLPATALPRARLMGAWDHFYPDSAFDPGVSTHYVNLPHWLDLSAEEAATLALPCSGDDSASTARYAGQHARWRWQPLAQAAIDPQVHAYARIYAEWGLGRGR
jgi:colanic acid biosynthesis protein WcaH